MLAEQGFDFVRMPTDPGPMLAYGPGADQDRLLEHAADAGAVGPGAVEEDDLAAAGGADLLQGRLERGQRGLSSAGGAVVARRGDEQSACRGGCCDQQPGGEGKGRDAK